MAAVEIVDFVAALTSKDVDFVQRVYRSGHDRYCRYLPSINDHGLVYCDFCGSQIDCIHPECG